MRNFKILILMLVGSCVLMGCSRSSTPALTSTRPPTPTPRPPAGIFSEFALPTLYSRASGITAGPDGNLWFTAGESKIGKITTSGTITEYSTSNGGVEITTGPDGNLWFTNQRANKIERITSGR